MSRKKSSRRRANWLERCFSRHPGGRKPGPSGFTMAKETCVYIMASKRNGTLYVGVTSDLPKRVWEHKNHVVPGFTEQYKVHDLVWYEPHERMESVIVREKQLKKWHRDWKLDLIEKKNPYWMDLFNELT